MLIYVDMDDVLCDFTSLYYARKREEPEVKWPQSQVGFFLDLSPVKGAVEGFHLLTEHHDVHILTAPSVLNLHCYTEKAMWVKKYLGRDALPRLHLSPCKNLSKGDVLIDDNIEGKGQDGFEGRLIQFGSPEFPDWTAVVSELTP